MSSIIQGEQAMKATYVSQIQDRSVDIQRANAQAQTAFNEEFARRAEEVVEETEEVENNGIRNDQEGQKQEQEQKKQRRRRPNDPDLDDITDDWPMGPDDDGQIHKLNIIA